MGVMFIPVKYCFREREKLWAWKINGDYPQPRDLGKKCKMQSEILNVNTCYRLNHEVLQLEVPLQLSVLLNTLLKLSPSRLACKWEVLAISKLNLCFLWWSSRWKCWRMEDLGHLYSKAQTTLSGDRNTQEYNFIPIWKIYGPNFICIHQICT